MDIVPEPVGTKSLLILWNFSGGRPIGIGFELWCVQRTDVVQGQWENESWYFRSERLELDSYHKIPTFILYFDKQKEKLKGA